MSDVREYGRALFMLSEEEGKSDEVLADIAALEGAFLENPTYPSLLDTTALSKEEKLSLLDSSLSPLTEESVKSLMKILCEKRLAYAYKAVFAEYRKEYDLSRGIERVEAITAIALTERQRAALVNKLEGLLGKTVIIKNTIDRSTLGGIKLRYSGIQVDATVKARLDDLSQSLSALVI